MRVRHMMKADVEIDLRLTVSFLAEEGHEDEGALHLTSTLADLLEKFLEARDDVTVAQAEEIEIVDVWDAWNE